MKDQDATKLKELYSSVAAKTSVSELDELAEQITIIENRHLVICTALAISMVSVSKGAALVYHIMVNMVKYNTMCSINSVLLGRR